MKLAISLFTFFLCLIQIFLSKNPPLLSQTEVDLIEQQQRMNDYPPPYFRLANIFEKRPESRLFFKLQNNFFAIFNLNLLPFILVPIILIGFFDLIKNRNYWYILFLLIIPTITLTFTGPNQTWGNFCLLPFIIISTINGLFSFIKK